MVYKFFDKKTAGSVIKSIPQNEQLPEELHKPIIRKSSVFNICGADLADMQLISKFNKGFRCLLCVVDNFTKYAWVFPLKDKKRVSIANAFQSILKDFNRRSNKICVDKGGEFYNNSFKNSYKTMILLYIQHIMKANLLLPKGLLEP